MQLEVVSDRRRACAVSSQTSGGRRRRIGCADARHALHPCRLPPLRRRAGRVGAERAQAPFELEEVDIETSDALVAEYGVRIPVVALDGVEVFEYAVVLLAAMLGG